MKKPSRPRRTPKLTETERKANELVDVIWRRAQGLARLKAELLADLRGSVRRLH